MSTTHFVIYWKEVSWSPLAKEPGRAAWKHDTDVQNRADVNLTLRDVLERSVVESAGLDWNVQSKKTTLSSWHARLEQEYASLKHWQDVPYVVPYSLQAAHDDILATASHNLILVRVSPLDVPQEAAATNEEGAGMWLP